MIENNDTKEYKCQDCGDEINEGEAKTFTCCDACWKKHYKSREKINE